MGGRELIVVRQATENDISALADLEKAVYGPLGTGYFREEHIRCWLEVFPEGLFVAEQGDLVVGFGYCQRVNFHSVADLNHSFNQATDFGYSRKSHAAQGNALYGVTYCSIGRGAGAALVGAALDLVAKLGCEFLVGHSRMAGFDNYIQSIKDKFHFNLANIAESDIAAHYAICLAEKSNAHIDAPMLNRKLDGFPEPEYNDISLIANLHIPEVMLCGITNDYMTDFQSHDFAAILVARVTTKPS